jgi:hypothetical protein
VEMKKQEINKKLITKSLVKMVSTKETVLSYIKGKVTLEELTKKGIKFANPL